MNKYIGFKLIEAEPMTLGDYNTFKGWQIPSNENPLTEGYKVKYSDDYISWSPKNVFEKAYMQVGDNNKITEQNVEDFIKEYEVYELDGKTTILKATLANNFTIIESSSCVDPANYDVEIGKQACMERIVSKVWNHLGFLLQTAKDGIK